MFSTLYREAESKSHLGRGPLLGELEGKARRWQSCALLQEGISGWGFGSRGGAEVEKVEGL